MRAPPVVLRGKLLMANRGPALAAALVVVGLLAFGGAAWTITHPPTVEVTEQVATHTVGTDVTTSSVVTGNTSLWDRGTTLTNKPIYPLKSAPQLTVEVYTTVPTGEEVYVSQELTLVYQATKDDAVFWETERPLVAEEQTVTAGMATVSTTVDVQRVRRHLDEINAEITGLGRAQASLRLNVSYRANDYSGTLTKTAPMTILESGYWIGGSLDAENTHQTPRTREQTQPPDTSKALGLGLLGLLSLGGAGGVVYASSRRFDPESITDELDRQRYREWVSAGQLSQFVTGQDVSMDSLGDLVDVAIDSNHRVVHDRSRELYAVVDGNTIYYYDPHRTGPDIEFEPEEAVPLRHDGGHAPAFGGTSRAGRASGGDAVSDGNRPHARHDDEPDDVGELSTDAVSVSREIALESGRAVATYRLSTGESGLVAVDVADKLPEACDLVDSLRPLDDHGPTDVLRVEGGIGFQMVTSEPDDRAVKYEVRTTAPVTEDVLATLRDVPGPKVRRAVALGSPEDR